MNEIDVQTLLLMAAATAPMITATDITIRGNGETEASDHAAMGVSWFGGGLLANVSGLYVVAPVFLAMAVIEAYRSARMRGSLPYGGNGRS